MLYIIRGLPGSGKSTLARALSIPHVEANQYFIQPDSTYTCDASKLKEAHQYCWNWVDYYLSIGTDCVVSNTFTTKKEMQPYIDLASKHEVNYLIIEAQYNGTSIHNVPETTIERMRKRYEHITDKDFR